MHQHANTILVTGGTGTLGRAFTDAAEDAGYRVRVMSRSPAPDGLPDGREWARADVVTAEGLQKAVRGVDAVLHAASDPTGDPDAVDVEGTRKLLRAAAAEGVDHLLYPSIVGIHRMPYFYYDAKEKAEKIVADAPVPHTTVRITPFHSFVEEILAMVGKLPILPLPTRARVQSIADEEAADHLVERLAEGPAGRVPDVAGPEVRTLGEMARSWRRIRGKRRWIVRLPVPGELARGFREGRGTVPDRAVGFETWEEWLERTEDGPTNAGRAPPPRPPEEAPP